MLLNRSMQDQKDCWLLECPPASVDTAVQRYEAAAVLPGKERLEAETMGVQSLRGLFRFLRSLANGNRRDNGVFKDEPLCQKGKLSVSVDVGSPLRAGKAGVLVSAVALESGCGRWSLIKNKPQLRGGNSVLRPEMHLPMKWESSLVRGNDRTVGSDRILKEFEQLALICEQETNDKYANISSTQKVVEELIGACLITMLL